MLRSVGPRSDFWFWRKARQRKGNERERERESALPQIHPPATQFHLPIEEATRLQPETPRLCPLSDTPETTIIAFGWKSTRPAQQLAQEDLQSHISAPSVRSGRQHRRNHDPTPLAAQPRLSAHTSILYPVPSLDTP